MPTFDYNDIRKHSACVARGHDFRQIGQTTFFKCKCGAAARLTDGGIHIDNAQPLSREEHQAMRANRKARHING